MILYGLLGLILIALIGYKTIFIIPFFILLIYLYIKKNNKAILIFLLSSIGGFCNLNCAKLTRFERDSFLGMVVEKKENYLIFASLGKRYYLQYKDNEFEIFDILYIKGYTASIVDTTLESEFNFSKYLFDKGITEQIRVNSLEIKCQSLIRPSKFKKKFLSKFDKNSQIIINGMIFSHYDSSLMEKLSKLNLYSLYSTSNYHFYLLFSFFIIIGRNVFKNKKQAYILAIVLSSPLIIFSNYKISIIKSIVFSFVYNALDIKGEKNRINAFFLFLLIYFNINYIFTVECLYVFAVPFIISIIINSAKIIEKKYQKITKFILIQSIFSLFNLFYQGYYNYLFIFEFLLLSFFSQIIYILIVISIYMFPFINVINFLSNILLVTINYLYQLNSVIYFNKNDIILLILSLSLLFIAVYFMEINLKKQALCTYLSLCVIISLFSLPIDAYTSDYVSFINVGQGDCILIHNRKINVLIDTGGSLYKDIGRDVIYPYLKHHHINFLNTIFISHNDYDHNGGLSALKSLIRIDNIVVGSQFYYQEVGNLKFYNLNKYQIGVEENDNSSVIYLEFINKSFLFMGDAPIEIENKIINDYPDLHADILKVGHHGSNTSSSYQFLKTVSPKEAIISVGVNNRYNHPNADVIARLNNLNIKIRRTDREGTITYK